MASPPEYNLKMAFKIWLYIFIALMLTYYSTCFVYWSIVILPFVCAVIHKWTLPPVDDWTADQILGEALTLNSKKKTGYFPNFAIAHRTCALDAPENTLAGIKKAKNDGAAGVEFDVRFTKDDVGILIHDDNVDRTTDGHGKVANMTFAQIRTLDASAKHIYHTKFKGEKIPTLDEAVQLCLELNLKIFLEAKDIDDRALQKILELYAKDETLYEKCVIVSFYPQFLYKLRSKDPLIVTLLVWRPLLLSSYIYTPLSDDRVPRFPHSKVRQTLATIGDYFVDWGFHNIFWRLSGAAGVLVHRGVISPSYLTQWAQLRVRVLAWVVDDPHEKEYFSSVLKLSYLTDTIQHSPVSNFNAKCLK